MFDLRLPAGIFFVITGFVLISVGLVSPATRAVMTDTNLNLWAGLAILLFGGLLLLLARRESSKNKVRKQPDSRTK